MLVETHLVQNGHLFAGLPLHVVRRNTAEGSVWPQHATDASPGEDASLLNEAATPKRHRARIKMWQDSAVAVLATSCACLAVVTVLIISLAYRRFAVTIDGVQAHVNVVDSASNVIKNVDNLLNSTAHVAAIVHELGLKGLDARVFAAPYLTRLLNTTTMIADDAHTILEHPKISIG